MPDKTREETRKRQVTLTFACDDVLLALIGRGSYLRCLIRTREDSRISVSPYSFCLR
ncbi:hypothetical protein M0802_013122 [Mischocyttarus mexicanus]|nr:hypothetical protein M0802_013122 [Mischocyttarus mexicanus]